MTRAAVYARQSLDVSEGIERQQKRCGQLIDARGWDAGPVYVDNDTSASRTRGPKTAWARMLQAIGVEFDVIVAVDLDRLLRSTRDLNVLIERGARVVTVDGEIDLTTADGEFRATMLAGIARFETRRKAERQIRANEHRVAQGKPSTASKRRPFGFEHDGVTHRPDEAKALAEAYEALILGHSQASIAKQWNAAGYTTSGGKAWHSGSVGHVLANPRNAGILEYNGVERGPAPWEGIVTEPVYRLARAILRVGRTGLPKPGLTLLGGLARCGICGGIMVAGQAHERRTYVCKGFRHLSRVADHVDAVVDAVVVAYLVRGGVAEPLAVPTDERAEGLTKEAAELRARMDELAGLFADGTLTASQLATATERLRDRGDAIDRELAGLAMSARPAPSASVLGASDVAGAWSAASVETRRQIVDDLAVVTIVKTPRRGREFDPESVRVVWKGLAEHVAE
ncbi:recombinase family protein [Agromyces tardus]|uniref:Recombinase family protein n=1 Tax=Agromyces tardus TaxID=2583849 RepID=A0A3M8A7B7_9MICO|nr:recombinase family protein [Agromyces tardus]RNB46547.1 recombinase family protein [Agromyces tardus]